MCWVIHGQQFILPCEFLEVSPTYFNLLIVFILLCGCMAHGSYKLICLFNQFNVYHCRLDGTIWKRIYFQLWFQCSLAIIQTQSQFCSQLGTANSSHMVFELWYYTLWLSGICEEILMIRESYLEFWMLRKTWRYLLLQGSTRLAVTQHCKTDCNWILTKF